MYIKYFHFLVIKKDIRLNQVLDLAISIEIRQNKVIFIVIFNVYFYTGNIIISNTL